jgi:hypothetical protein
MPATMTPTQFQDFMNTTRPTILTDAMSISNLLQRNVSPFFDFLRGRTMNDIARAVPFIDEMIYLYAFAQTGPYTPGQARTIGMGERSQQLKFQFASIETPTGWTVSQFKSNTNGGERERVKDYKKLLRMDQVTSHVNFLDDTLFRRPDSAKMEDAPALSKDGLPKSMLCAITEDDPAIQWTPPGWGSTKLMNVPVTEKKWSNQVVFYDPSKLTDVKSAAGFLAAQDEMATRLTFKPPIEAKDAMQVSELGTGVLAYTNMDGFKTLKTIKRSLNDFEARDGNLSADRINYNGVEYVWAPQLDTELLDQTRATAGVASVYTGNAYPKGKPRVLWATKLNFKPIFYGDMMLKATDVMNGGLLQPDFFGQYIQSWLECVCNNRRRMGAIAPLAG